MNDDFTQRLRERADAAAPQIDVDTSTVLSRGRRRRTARRSATGLAVAATLVTGGWVAQAAPWMPSADPVRVATWGEDGSPADTGTPSAEPTAAVENEQVEEYGGPDGVPSGSWWYERSEGDGEVMEVWSSREQPGLLVWDGDLTTATGIGPKNTLGRFRIDGEWVDMVRDPAMLTTDPVALADVLYASVEPDVRTGTPDEKVAGMVRDLLAEGGLLPAELRHAVWTVGTRLPGVQVREAEDSTGRPGEVLEYTQDGAPSALVRDPVTGLLLEEAMYLGTDDAWSRVYLEQRVADTVPVEPTLENAGCADWSTC